jgi:hypothetical protein
MRRFEIEIDRGLSEAIVEAGGAEVDDMRPEPISSR